MRLRHSEAAVKAPQWIVAQDGMRLGVWGYVASAEEMPQLRAALVKALEQPDGSGHYKVGTRALIDGPGAKALHRTEGTEIVLQNALESATWALGTHDGKRIERIRRLALGVLDGWLLDDTYASHSGKASRLIETQLNGLAALAEEIVEGSTPFRLSGHDMLRGRLDQIETLFRVECQHFENRAEQTRSMFSVNANQVASGNESLADERVEMLAEPLRSRLFVALEFLSMIGYAAALLQDEGRQALIERFCKDSCGVLAYLVDHESIAHIARRFMTVHLRSLSDALEVVTPAPPLPITPLDLSRLDVQLTAVENLLEQLAERIGRKQQNEFEVLLDVWESQTRNEGI